MKMEMVLESVERGGTRMNNENEDGQKRKGTVWTATALCITAVMGSGVLALPWSVAQLGWIMGPLVLLAFASITYYTSTLLADCYRSPDPVNGTRNPTYMAAVKSYLGPKNVLVCFFAQYTILLWGTMLNYTITSATSMREIMRSNCLHKHGTMTCTTSWNSFMIMYGGINILFSMIPNMEEITWLSVLATVMSFGYSLISLCLCMAKWILHGETRGGVWGVISRNDTSLTAASKTWNAFQALGNIAFAYTFAEVLIEIQDTLKSTPSENVTMKKASLYGVSVTSIFYIAIGCLGYAAFGDNTPGNILTGFSEPFWLVDMANIFLIIHHIGAYPVFAHPIYALIEKTIISHRPDTKIFQPLCSIRVPFTKASSIPITPTKIVIRSSLIVFTTVVSMLLPFFNAIMGLLGAAAFFPVSVYLPVSMYLSQRKIERGATKWCLLQGLCLLCLAVCVAAMIGSVLGIIDSLRHTKPFQM